MYNIRNCAVQLITETELQGTCYVRVAMSLQPSDSAVVEQICWPWANTVSTSTWPGSKHKQHATGGAKARCILPGSKHKQQTTACLNVQTLNAFYHGMLNSHTYCRFDIYKIIMTVLLKGRNPFLNRIVLLRTFLPQGNNNQPTN